MLGVAITSCKDDPPTWRRDPDPPEPESWGFDGIHTDSDDSSSLNLGSTDNNYEVDKERGIDEKVDPPLNHVDESNVPSPTDEKVDPPLNNVKEPNVPSPTTIIKIAEESTSTVPTASSPHGDWWCCNIQHDFYEDISGSCKVSKKEKDKHTYSLVSGTGDADNSKFTIDANKTLKTAASFNYDHNSSLTIRVVASDQKGATFEKIFSIKI